MIRLTSITVSAFRQKMLSVIIYNFSYWREIAYSLNVNMLNQDPSTPTQQPLPAPPAEPVVAPEQPPVPPVPTEPTTEEIPKREGVWSIVGTILLIVAAPLIAVLLTLFVFQSYEVDGPSMQQTLQHQDRLIVNKIPKTMARITNSHYIPGRGDIIIFERKDLATGDFAHEGSKQLIKRVIGLPGDRVVVTNNQITIYTKDRPEGYNPDEGTDYAESISITSGNVDLVVPEGEVFVAGDNRTNSLDSRFFGTVPSDEIIGKLVLRLWPNTKTFN